MKSVSVIALILLAGLASAYTPVQQTALDGMNLSFKLGMAYEKASQGQNVAEFNTLVDEYNAWIRQHFGGDANLLKSKMNETGIIEIKNPDSGTAYLEANPFNTSSDLSKFGKQDVYVASGKSTLESQVDTSQQEASSF